jgi:hypothetical protein
MEDPLLGALGLPRQPRALRALVRAGLKARGRVVRFLPPRAEPLFARQLPQIRSYPEGYSVAELGTFPAGCPVPSPRDREAARAATPG